MKRYCLKSRAGQIDYIDIIKEIEDGYLVRLTRFCDGTCKISQETMTRHLFNICVKTGCIYELTAKKASVA